MKIYAEVVRGDSILIRCYNCENLLVDIPISNDKVGLLEFEITDEFDHECDD